MKRKWKLLAILMALLLLNGCALSTLDDLYQVPKRSDDYNDLQAAIDANMDKLEFCAPLNGENLQTVQMADLDGDGIQEYLLFAKGTEEKPLHILVFAIKNGEYALADTIESHGTAFDLVQYVQMDDQPGVELIVGCQISQDVARSVSVYSLRDGKIVSIMSTNYSKFLPCDLMGDACGELMVFHPAEAVDDKGSAELFHFADGALSLYDRITLSGSMEQLIRIEQAQFQNGKNAVYVNCVLDNNSVSTDVLAVVNGELVNLADSGK